MYCIDLFAGAGGLSTGLKLAGFQTIFANEISPTYAKTLAASHRETWVDASDIRRLDAASVRRTLQMERGDLDLLAGGPPCQGFSVNAPIRSTEDERNHLFREFLRFVDEFQPKAILLENVPGMISFDFGNTASEILKSLLQLGYQVDVRVLYAPHYGVPQARWRAIVLGNRIGVEPLEMFPVPTFFAIGRANFATRFGNVKVVLDDKEIKAFASQRHYTVGDAIFDLPPIDNGAGKEVMDYATEPQNDFQSCLRSGSRKVTNHKCAGLGSVNLERLPHIPPGGSWRDIPFDLLPKGMKRARKSDHTKRYGRLHPDQLASTILTKCDPHWGTYIHPYQQRVLSVREAARLQSFPDTVQFHGSLTEQYEQVGNAVPPLLAKCIGDRIAQTIVHRHSNRQDSMKSYTPWMKPQYALAV